jgi:hypothetical protein
LVQNRTHPLEGWSEKHVPDVSWSDLSRDDWNQTCP